VTYTVSLDGAYVDAVATGILTTEDVCDYEDAIETDDGVVKGFVELFDVRWIAESRIDQAGLARIAEKVQAGKKRALGSKLAIIVGQGDSFERAQYYRLMAYDAQNVVVFNFKHTAEIWLGVVRQEEE